MLGAVKVTSIPVSKRILDLLLAVAGTVLLSPLLLLISVLVGMNFGTPIIFRQKRPGYLGKPFWVYKFRSMTEARDAQDNLLPDAQRITRLGHFLRSSSLDELPEMFNVLRGEMSFVGPRPLLMQYLERYSPEQARQARGTARDHRLGPNKWSKCTYVGREIQARRLVC